MVTNAQNITLDDLRGAHRDRFMKLSPEGRREVVRRIRPDFDGLSIEGQAEVLRRLEAEPTPTPAKEGVIDETPYELADANTPTLKGEASFFERLGNGIRDLSKAAARGLQSLKQQALTQAQSEQEGANQLKSTALEIAALGGGSLEGLRGSANFLLGLPTNILNLPNVVKSAFSGEKFKPAVQIPEFLPEETQEAMRRYPLAATAGEWLLDPTLAVDAGIKGAIGVAKNIKLPIKAPKSQVDSAFDALRTAHSSVLDTGADDLDMLAQQPRTSIVPPPLQKIHERKLAPQPQPQPSGEMLMTPSGPQIVAPHPTKEERMLKAASTGLGGYDELLSHPEGSVVLDSFAKGQAPPHRPAVEATGGYGVLRDQLGASVDYQPFRPDPKAPEPMDPTGGYGVLGSFPEGTVVGGHATPGDLPGSPLGTVAPQVKGQYDLLSQPGKSVVGGHTTADDLPASPLGTPEPKNPMEGYPASPLTKSEFDQKLEQLAQEPPTVNQPVHPVTGRPLPPGAQPGYFGFGLSRPKKFQPTNPALAAQMGPKYIQNIKRDVKRYTGFLKDVFHWGHDVLDKSFHIPAIDRGGRIVPGQTVSGNVMLGIRKGVEQRIANGYAETNKRIADLFADLNPKNINETLWDAANYLYHKDLLARLRQDPNHVLPTGMTQASIKAELDRIEAYVNSLPPDRQIDFSKAVTRTRQTLDEYGKELQGLGILGELRQDYFPHNLSEYFDDSFLPSRLRGSGATPGFAEKAKGSQKTPKLDLLENLSDYMNASMRAKEIRALKHEILDKYSIRDWKGQPLPEGFDTVHFLGKEYAVPAEVKRMMDKMTNAADFGPIVELFQYGNNIFKSNVTGGAGNIANLARYVGTNMLSDYMQWFSEAAWRGIGKTGKAFNVLFKGEKLPEQIEQVLESIGAYNSKQALRNPTVKEARFWLYAADDPFHKFVRSSPITEFLYTNFSTVFNKSVNDFVYNLEQLPRLSKALHDFEAGLPPEAIYREGGKTFIHYDLASPNIRHGSISLALPFYNWFQGISTNTYQRLAPALLKGRATPGTVSRVIIESQILPYAMMVWNYQVNKELTNDIITNNPEVGPFILTPYKDSRGNNYVVVLPQASNEGFKKVGLHRTAMNAAQATLGGDAQQAAENQWRDIAPAFGNEQGLKIPVASAFGNEFIRSTGPVPKIASGWTFNYNAVTQRPIVPEGVSGRDALARYMQYGIANSGIPLSPLLARGLSVKEGYMDPLEATISTISPVKITTPDPYSIGDFAKEQKKEQQNKITLPAFKALSDQIRDIKGDEFSSLINKTLVRPDGTITDDPSDASAVRLIKLFGQHRGPVKVDGKTVVKEDGTPATRAYFISRVKDLLGSTKQGDDLSYEELSQALIQAQAEYNKHLAAGVPKEQLDVEYVPHIQNQIAPLLQQFEQQRRQRLEAAIQAAQIVVYDEEGNPYVDTKEQLEEFKRLTGGEQD